MGIEAVFESTKLVYVPYLHDITTSKLILMSNKPMCFIAPWVQVCLTLTMIISIMKLNTNLIKL